MLFIITSCNNRRLKRILLFCLYLAIIAGLILLYGKGDFSAPAYIYQGF
jgi:hypothetical protein